MDSTGTCTEKLPSSKTLLELRNTLDCCLSCPSVVSPLYRDTLCIVINSIPKELAFLLVQRRSLAQFSVRGVLGDSVIFIQHGEMGGIVSGFSISGFNASLKLFYVCFQKG